MTGRTARRDGHRGDGTGSAKDFGVAVIRTLTPASIPRSLMARMARPASDWSRRMTLDLSVRFPAWQPQHSWFCRDEHQCRDRWLNLRWWRKRCQRRGPRERQSSPRDVRGTDSAVPSRSSRRALVRVSCRRTRPCPLVGLRFEDFVQQIRVASEIVLPRLRDQNDNAVCEIGFQKLKRSSLAPVRRGFSGSADCCGASPTPSADAGRPA